ncbi:LEAF RUST 10 DISEASE-RESISTANCE LOCUS RECEPTOR-LIKE PROTEIN KINASE-like 1.2 isoform X3 [Alnus glutinosa]|uniref:LEAF RUST 10 DISEASE-RESISTANCE LOCUS RECEPTOR-LIKE PROTEIN KINASE-like 1.2 isoform X3 n=1 Tax=Alnus glutinosa TaxID=3517 RepID=UPI002D76AD04|nr:LEAF RUST 10 DISEASE-RESISTANCE LOCUS RECEPTOR-LIKE PROTEIN KINASE-like 1.2 isoform X3 [Alnus glutinosa]
METQNFFTSQKPFHIFILFIIFIFTNLANLTLSLNQKFQACTPRACGNGPNISYPFWIQDEQQPFCGYPNFGITCNEQNPVLEISNDEYIIKDIFHSNQSLLVANAAVYKDACPTPLHNVNLDRTPFNLTFTLYHSDLSFFYNCTSVPAYPTYEVACASKDNLHSFAVFHEEAYQLEKTCQSLVNVPVDMLIGDNWTSLFHMNYTEILKMGFLLTWSAPNCSNCENSGGRCGFDNSEFVCFCLDGDHHKTCHDGKANWKLKTIIGVCASIGTVAIMLIIFFIYQRRNKKKYAPSSYVSRSISSYPSSVTDPERGVSNYFGVPLFSYTELEKATNNFDSGKELGEGGFGIVYYGKLQDGRQVAVKRLYENNCRRVEQFMNEIAILTRLRHQNLVSLYGCTSRHSRELVLVYEYVPNGTVADHIHGEYAKPGALPWPTRMKIALETASALTYLHASDTIHRDVKTNNILLDDNFCVKVADFGLSRLFPTDVTHVSTAPQGTPGYVDPEYHECYQLTGKSDVFSFGVVLIELISSMPAVDITRHRHEINLSNMAINKIQNHTLHELVDQSLGFKSDYTVQRMITAVAELAFQCLQHDKDLRPSMAEVLEALQDIQNKDYTKDEAEEMDIAADDVGLLKKDPPPLSPDSALNWISTSTTSISST